MYDILANVQWNDLIELQLLFPVKWKPLRVITVLKSQNLFPVIFELLRISFYFHWGYEIESLSLIVIVDYDIQVFSVQISASFNQITKSFRHKTRKSFLIIHSLTMNALNYNRPSTHLNPRKLKKKRRKRLCLTYHQFTLNVVNQFN